MRYNVRKFKTFFVQFKYDVLKLHKSRIDTLIQNGGVEKI